LGDGFEADIIITKYFINS